MAAESAGSSRPPRNAAICTPDCLIPVMTPRAPAATLSTISVGGGVGPSVGDTAEERPTYQDEVIGGDRDERHGNHPEDQDPDHGTHAADAICETAEDGERRAPVNPLAVTRIPICHRSPRNSSIRLEARTPNALCPNVATPIAVAVTAANENRLNGRVGGLVIDN